MLLPRIAVLMPLKWERFLRCSVKRTLASSWIVIIDATQPSSCKYCTIIRTTSCKPVPTDPNSKTQYTNKPCSCSSQHRTPVQGRKTKTQPSSCRYCIIMQITSCKPALRDPISKSPSTQPKPGPAHHSTEPQLRKNRQPSQLSSCRQHMIMQITSCKLVPQRPKFKT